MAKCEVSLPDGFLLELSQIENKTEQAVDKALKKGAEYAFEIMRDKLKSALSGKSTGQLERALGISPVGSSGKTGRNVHVGFDDKRTDEKKFKGANNINSAIAGVLEYGKSGQAPTNWLKKSRRVVESNVETIMANELEELL